MAKSVQVKLIPPAKPKRDLFRAYVQKHHPEWLSEYDQKFPKQKEA